MRATLVLVTKGGWQSWKNSFLLHLADLRVCIKGLHRIQHSPQGQPLTQVPVRRGKEGADDQKPSCQQCAGLWGGRPQPGLLCALLPSHAADPCQLTPNLLIPIIDLINKGRISNSHKYEPCLERLERRNISSMKYSYAWWVNGQLDHQNKTHKTKQSCSSLHLAGGSCILGNFLFFFSLTDFYAFFFFCFLDVLSLVLDVRCKL